MPHGGATHEVQLLTARAERAERHARLLLGALRDYQRVSPGASRLLEKVEREMGEEIQIVSLQR